MGFLRRLFGSKKPGHSSDGSGYKPGKDNKRRWSFGKHSNRAKSLPPPPPPFSALNHFDSSSSSLEANKHAIAVAAATAAVAEAALAAAHAAAEVVRLTSGGTGGSRTNSRPATVHVSQRQWPEETAAVKIQSAFRGYLARRALRALKALVKLQALVRGHIVRKQTADMLRRMQTLVRLQAQARASRAHLSDNMHSFKSSLSHCTRCSSNANFRNIDSERMRFGSNWLDRWMEENVCSQARDGSLRNGHPDDKKSDKILEVDTWRPHFNSHHGSSSFQTAHYYWSSDYNNDNFMAYESPSKRSTKALNQSLSSRDVLPLSSSKIHEDKEAAASRTADSSPQAFSASSRHGSGARRGPFTPTRSECLRGFFNGYAGYPNYMANTESSRAKGRSQSAPRQRLEFDRYGSTRRFVQGVWDVGPNSDGDSDLRNKACLGSSRLNRIGSPNLR